jgi:hypothetical protein
MAIESARNPSRDGILERECISIGMLADIKLSQLSVPMAPEHLLR